MRTETETVRMVKEWEGLCEIGKSCEVKWFEMAGKEKRRKDLTVSGNDDRM
jgi:hypothetical protein